MLNTYLRMFNTQLSLAWQAEESVSDCRREKYITPESVWIPPHPFFFQATEHIAGLIWFIPPLHPLVLINNWKKTII